MFFVGGVITLMGLIMFPTGIYLDMEFGLTALGIIITLSAIPVTAVGATILVWDRGRIH